MPLELDINDAESIVRTVLAIDVATQGRGLDFLVDNAGYSTAGALVEMSGATLRTQFETNVFGLMSLTRTVLPSMMRRGEGRIINISSVSGRVPAPILGAYHATKYAVEALSNALRMEVAAFGVKVVIVEPGTVKTEFAARTMEEAQKAAQPGSRYASVYARAKETEAKFASAASGPEPCRALRGAAHVLRAHRAHEALADRARRRSAAHALRADEEGARAACSSSQQRVRPARSLRELTDRACRCSQARRS